MEQEKSNIRVAITYTIFTEDEDYVNWFSLDYTVQVGKHLNYGLLKRTVGKHVDAARTHYHICCIYELLEGSKFYKVLNEKILRFNEIQNLPGNYNDVEKKISFIYEGQQKKTKKGVKMYDESSLQYPFKEYEKDHEVFYHAHLHTGFTDEELRTMRKCANIEWQNVLRKREQQEQMRINKQAAEEKEEAYIKENIKEINGSYEFMLRETIKHILQYSKAHDQNIRTNTLKDKAINYLYKNNKITTDQIIDHLYI